MPDAAAIMRDVVARLRAVYAALVRVRPPRIFGVVLRNPRDSMFAVALALAIIAIVANGLYLQPGRHPAPIFAIRTRPVISDEPATTAVQVPRRRPGEAGAPKPESPKPDSPGTEQVAKTEPVPLPRRRPEPAGEAANPLWRLTAVQRTLNQSGYGPIRVTGILDDPTREAIARFEGAHNLPVTGLNTPRLRHALGVGTGRAVD